MRFHRMIAVVDRLLREATELQAVVGALLDMESDSSPRLRVFLEELTDCDYRFLTRMTVMGKLKYLSQRFDAFLSGDQGPSSGR